MSGRKIVLPNDERVREALRFKMQEYKRRLEGAQRDIFKHPDLIFMQNTDSAYKFVIAKALLDKGEVDTWELSKAFYGASGYVDVESFNNAADVINNYVRANGRNVRGGTGFPITPKAREQLKQRLE